MTGALPAAEPTQLEPGIVYQIPVEALTPDPLQPRKHIDQDALAGFAADIRARGVLMPISAWETDEGLRIKSGERRWRAAQLAGLTTVPVLIEDRPPDLDSRFDQVAENTQREGLSAADQLRFLGQLAEDGATVNDLAAALSKRGIELGPKDIVKRLEVLRLPASVMKLLDAGAKPEVLAPLTDLLDVPGFKWDEVAEDLSHGMDWRGNLTITEVKSTAKGELNSIAVSLTETDKWLGAKAVPFSWKNRCKKCPHLLKFEGGVYCMDEKLYTQHAAEARAAGLDFGGQAVAKPKTDAPADGLPLETPEAEPSQSWQARVQNYLHEGARRALDAVDWFHDRHADTVAALNAWAADGSPGHWGRRHNDPEFDDLDSYLCADGGTGLSAEERARHVALTLDFAHARDVLHVIHGPDLLTWWVLDDEFLQLFKGAQLKAMLEEHAPNAKPASSKVADVRDALVAAWPAAPWVHPVLAKLYAPRFDALMPDDEDEDSDEAYPEDADEEDEE